jgi:hypothetical protein
MSNITLVKCPVCDSTQVKKVLDVTDYFATQETFLYSTVTIVASYSQTSFLLRKKSSPTTIPLNTYLTPTLKKG